MTATLTADPFLIQVADGVDFAAEVLEHTFAQSADWAAKGGDGNRWYELDDSWVFMDSLAQLTTKGTKTHPQQSFYLGSVLRARTDELPVQVGAKGISPLALADDEGIGEHVAFLWDPETSLIWLQREHQVGRSALLQYWRAKSGKAAGITPVFQDDAPARAKKLKDVKRIEFTYLVAKSGQKPKGLFAFVSSLEQYGGAAIEITVKPERGAHLGPGARDAVRQLADEVESKRGTLAKAQVWGDVSVDQRDQFIDMFRPRGQFSMSLGTRLKTHDPARLRAAVHSIWLAHRDEVKV